MWFVLPSRVGYNICRISGRLSNLEVEMWPTYAQLLRRLALQSSTAKSKSPINVLNSRNLEVFRQSSSSSKLFQAQSVNQQKTTEETAEKNVTESGPEQSEVIEVSTDQNQQDESNIARRSGMRELEDTFAPYRYVYPEFLPDPTIKFRNRIREKLERMDMLNRRANIDIPEFYVGSILSVTVSDKNAPGKTSTFVGICTQRDGTAMRSSFTLRNVVDGMGVEICYDLYNPTIQNITCLKLEKRLDDTLRYLRDAPPEYSTFPFDMPQELRNPDAPVPVNPLKVKLNPRPWMAKWHLWDLKGIEDVTEGLEPWRKKKFELFKISTGFEAKKYDLMKQYRESIHAEEQIEILSEVAPQLTKLNQSMKRQRRKRTFVKPQKAA